MKKTLITSLTALAIVLNAGMSMAGPLGDHAFRGPTHDVRSSVSQALDTADLGANTHQIDRSYNLGQNTLSSAQHEPGDTINVQIQLPNFDPDGDQANLWLELHGR